MATRKLADLGTLAAGMAHEINSPLQVITGMSHSLLTRLDEDGLDPDSLRCYLDVINRNAWRCAEIVRSLSIYARAPAGQFEPNDLNALVRDTFLLIEHQLKSWSNISGVRSVTPELPSFQCARNQITQVLINLLTNARDAMPEGGEITIRTGCDPQARRFILQVADTGVGIPRDIRDRIFDPFFTTKPVGDSIGLGLAIVDGIVRAYSGEIEVDSTPGRGTTFTLFFPVNEAGAANHSFGFAQDRFTPVAEGGRFDDPGNSFNSKELLHSC